MSVRKSSAYRVTMIVLSLVCLGGAGFLVYRTYIAKDSAETLLANARQRYAAGAAADKAGNNGDATKAYSEAAIHAENGLAAVRGAVEARKVTADDTKPMRAEFFTLHARAVRDREYTKAAADGKPLVEPLDTTLSVNYRSFAALPNGEDIQATYNDLRQATDLDPENPDLALDLLRMEFMQQPLPWPSIARLCETILKKSPNDSRANYCLARELFQQGGSKPTDKSLDRVTKAEKYLADAENNKSPYWRTEWLRLQMLAWHAERAAAARDKGEKAKRAAALRDELFKPSGPLALAADGFALVPLTSFDTDGLFGVHRLALAVLTSDPAKPPAPGDVRAVCESAVKMGEKLAASESKAYLPQAGAVIADVTAAAGPLLGKDPKGGWEDVSKAARDFFAKHPTAVGGAAAVRVALLTAQEASAARKRGDAEAANKLQAEAVAALEAGLKTATDQKRPADRLEYTRALLEVKWADGAKPDAIAPHVAVLRGIDLPAAKGVANFYDAYLSMRRGQLEKGRQLFDAVLQDKTVPGFALRCRIALAELSLTLDQPSDAAVHFGQVEDAYARRNELPASDRDTLDSRFTGPDEVTALRVVATLRAGLQRLAREARSQPGQPLGERKENVLRPVLAMMKTLRVPVDKDKPAPDRTARLALTSFLLAVGDRDEAGKRLDALALDYPRSADILRARVAFRMLPTAGETAPPADARAKADDLIERFTRENADVRAGKLLWAEWLIRTGRGKEADEYLRNPVHFPDQKDRVIERLRAGALFQAGNREEATKLLGSLPPDQNIDLLLLQVASTPEQREALLKSALGRYENNGRFRVYEAAIQLGEKKFEAAAEELLGLVEDTALRQTARNLLERTLIAYADADLKAATAYVAKLTTTHPDEPTVYAGAAFVALLNENVGEPGDAWPAKKSMYAALNQWEPLALDRPGQAGKTPAEVGLTRMRFHQLAGKPIAARQEGVRLLARNKSVDLLLTLADLYLSPPDAQPETAKKYLAEAYELVPPGSVRLLATEVAVKERTDDLAGAVTVGERMTTQFPNDSTGYRLLIHLATVQKKPADAAKWAVKWAEKQPDNDLAVLELIRQYTATGAKPAAEREADSLVKKVAERAVKAAEAAPADPKNPIEKRVADARAVANRAVAAAFLQAKAFDAADARIKAALADAPKDLATRMLAGDLALMKQDWDGAVTVYQSLFDEDNTNGVVANNLAWLLATKKDKPAEALALVEKARTRQGASKPIGAERLRPEFLDTIGIVYAKQKSREKYEEMRSLFEDAARRYPGDPRMHFWLAEAYAALGENSKALPRYAVVVSLCEKAIPGISDADRTQLRDQADAKRKKLN